MIATLLLSLVLPACSQEDSGRIVLRNEFLFYMDNTEFFNNFRDGETFLGAYGKSYLDIRTGERTSVHLGVFADHDSGSSMFLDPIKPIFSFRWEGEHATGILGTLETRHRHGLLEPLEQRQLDYSRPIEYGGQWLEDREHFRADVFINWQRLVSTTQREVFDYGGSASWEAFGPVSLDLQLHGYHEGGQATSTGSVVNNMAGGPGVRIEGSLPLDGWRGGVGAWYLASTDTVMRKPAKKGWGAMARAFVAPSERWELFVIAWESKDFIAWEGDRHYSSLTALGTGYFQKRRTYQELGSLWKWALDEATSLEASARAHWVQGRFEYSYGLEARTGFDVTLKR